MAKEHLDLKGLKCPLPVLRANKKMKSLASGDELTVKVTDPAAPKDFEAYCDTTGHTHVSCVQADDGFVITLVKA